MRRQRGFTLIEVAITVTILAMAAGVAIPALSNITRADLRKSSKMLAGYVRGSYDQCALSGHMFRLVFRFGKNVITLEETSDKLVFDSEKNIFVAAAKRASSGGISVPSWLHMDLNLEAPPKDGSKPDDRSKESSSSRKHDEEEEDNMGTFKKVSEIKIDADVHLLDIWISGFHEPQSEGEAYLYFFPHGYTQDALIHLEDDDKRIFTVKISALTGHASVFDTYVEVPK